MATKQKGEALQHKSTVPANPGRSPPFLANGSGRQTPPVTNDSSPIEQFLLNLLSKKRNDKPSQTIIHTMGGLAYKPSRK